jgi:Carboxypeptidase regulatory-like domain
MRFRSSFGCRSRRDGGKRKRLIQVAVWVLALMTLASAPALWAKKKKGPTTRTVNGIVTDAKGAAIDGATVSLKDMQTGEDSAVYTKGGGHYQFLGLDFKHDYQLQAKNAKGETSDTRMASSLDDRPILTINFQIPPEPEEQ